MKVNISIDDICPHPKSTTRVLDQCYRLIDNFADIKFTLFIPMAYTRLNEKSYNIKDDSGFCDTLRNLDMNHFELAWHGFLHGIPGVSNNDEFRYLNLDKATNVINKMFDAAKEANLTDKFKPILRPPAFWMSEDSFIACRNSGIKILALSPYKEYNNRDVKFNKVAKVIYFDCLPPVYPLLKKDKIEIVYHASEWNKNILDNKQVGELSRFLSSSDGGIDFVFMENF